VNWGLAHREQERQGVITRLLSRSLARAWGVLDVNDMQGTMPKFRLAVAGLVDRFSLSSATSAADYYHRQREDAGIRGRYLPAPAPAPSLDEIGKQLDWATQDLTAPLVAVQEALASAEKAVAGVSQKLVVDRGRDTITNAVNDDRHAYGWSRVAQPDACYFCAILATRGPVYKSREVFAASNAKFHGVGEIKVHNNCHCIPVPLFSEHYEAPDYVQEWLRIYYQAKRGARRGQSDLNAFRAALNARRQPS
jgi:hypothetical protein